MTRKEEILLNNDILSIIIGDSSFGNSILIEEKMPYLSGNEICLIANKMGYDIKYNEDETKGFTRTQYIKNVIEYCINNQKLSDLFNEITDKKRYTYLANHSYNNDGLSDYYHLINDFQNSINNILAFYSVTLLRDNNMWYIKEFDVDKIIIPLNEKINTEYINKKYEEIIEEINKEKYNHALTLSKNMIEKTFKLLLDNKHINYSNNDDMNDLYKEVKSSYSLNANGKMNQNLKKIMSGLNSIIDGITGIRNLMGDAHDHIENEFGLRAFDLKMIVNSSKIVCEYLINIMESEKC